MKTRREDMAGSKTREEGERERGKASFYPVKVVFM